MEKDSGDNNLKLSDKNDRKSDEDPAPTKKFKIDNISYKIIPKSEASTIETYKYCPYLGTIKRHMLDFDFEKLCSISLSNLNVYACLVCGKYYQGRGNKTHAYFHSLELNHHIYINLHNQKVFCLPDNYEVFDISLNDIKFNLRPFYTKDDIINLDSNVSYSRGLDGTDYLPGFVGLNNIKCTDYVNVVIQALAHLPVLRDFFILFENKQYTSDIFDFKNFLSKRFAELIRKIWNPKNFKGHVSPHELLQAISIKSSKKFRIDEQSDPIKLLVWLLNNLDQEIVKSHQSKKIITDCFQGEIEIHELDSNCTQVKKSEIKPFLYLTLNIPNNPLYKDDSEKSIIPLVPIFNLLKKYDGETISEDNKIYRLKKLPKYLIFHMQRFKKNNFFVEKNPTIVSFPLNNLDLKPYVNIDLNSNSITKYNLIVNICHEGKPKGGFYKAHIKNKASNQWFEMQDLHIAQVVPQLVTLSESYIQIYELQTE